jgi:hypothetical protein
MLPFNLSNCENRHFCLVQNCPELVLYGENGQPLPPAALTGQGNARVQIADGTLCLDFICNLLLFCSFMRAIQDTPFAACSDYWSIFKVIGATFSCYL